MKITHIVCENGCYAKKIPHKMGRNFVGVWKLTWWTNGLWYVITSMLYMVVINFLDACVCVVVILSCSTFVSV